MPNPAPPTAGDDVLAAWGVEVVDRIVPVFASTTERDQQLPVPDEGRVVYTLADHKLWMRKNTGWADISDVPRGSSTAYGSVKVNDAINSGLAAANNYAASPKAVSTLANLFASGQSHVTFAGGGPGIADLVVPFGKTFPKAPDVIISPWNAGAHAYPQRTTFYAHSITTTQFTAEGVYRDANGTIAAPHSSDRSVSFHWFSYGG